MLKVPKKKRSRRRQKCWIEKRATYSHINLIKELTNEPDDFRNYLRMDEATYRHLLDLISPLIKKDDTVMKRSITPHERLSATLRFLATGRSYEDLKFSTCISKSALSNIILETCAAIYSVLKQEYLKNVVKMVVCDDKVLFVKEVFAADTVVLTEKEADYKMMVGVAFADDCMSVFVEGDEAFAMRYDFLKPYNQRELNYQKRIFNYRLSRARRIIENTFGILANRFRIFHTCINLNVDNIDKVILACCALHNFLRRNLAHSYTPNDVFDCEYISTGIITPGLRTGSENLLDLASSHNRHYTTQAQDVRKGFE
ncbi:hypothetical protein NQ315_003373 [Exocentrus adspersus]|uniref:DDE Tnp4 domain-containing protein n=1 Tax=Exocentrus adspersus TaxID=1586481 RepID=A0AAV8VB19_9CUCU|nr:hypothetical protein NQ315_003373 [Exocentrus adspersus]